MLWSFTPLDPGSSDAYAGWSRLKLAHTARLGPMCRSGSTLGAILQSSPGSAAWQSTERRAEHLPVTWRRRQQPCCSLRHRPPIALATPRQQAWLNFRVDSKVCTVHARRAEPAGLAAGIGARSGWPATVYACALLGLLMLVSL